MIDETMKTKILSQLEIARKLNLIQSIIFSTISESSQMKLLMIYIRFRDTIHASSKVALQNHFSDSFCVHTNLSRDTNTLTIKFLEKI